MKAVIACGAAKIQTLPGQPVQAWRLYTGSLFKKALEAACVSADEIYILSAEYGLLKANDLVYTYNLKMTPARAKKVKARGLVHFSGISFLPATYESCVWGDLTRVMPAGLRMGFQMQWMTDYAAGKPRLVNLESLPDGELRQPMVL